MSGQLPKTITHDENGERSSREPSPIRELVPSSTSRRRASVALQRRSSTSKPFTDIKTACLGIPPHLSDAEKLNLMFEICFYHSLKTATDQSDADQDTIEEFSRELRATLPELLQLFQASETYASWLEKPSDTPKNVPEDNEYRQEAEKYKQESKAWNEAKAKARSQLEEARKEHSNVLKGIEVIMDKQLVHLPKAYQEFLKGKVPCDVHVARREKVLEKLMKATREIESIGVQILQRSEVCQGIIHNNIHKLGESLDLHVDHASIIDDFYKFA